MAIEALRIELPVTEARTRFLQLVRLTQLARQTTVIVDRGRPVAAIVPPELLEARSEGASAAGWLQRLEKVRDDLRRQHATQTDELRRALDEAWKVIDALRPPGTDRPIDTLRATHAPLRRPDRV
jgi:antitoxin (DNA-binding transcriptional repressor) of toxin-antitoxin stability system